MVLIQGPSPCLPPKVSFVLSTKAVGNNSAGDPSALATDVEVGPAVGFLEAATVSLVAPLVTQRAVPSPAAGTSSAHAGDLTDSAPAAAAAPAGAALSSAK